jgi:hypothetical protein
MGRSVRWAVSGAVNRAAIIRAQAKPHAQDVFLIRVSIADRITAIDILFCLLIPNLKMGTQIWNLRPRGSITRSYPA